MLNSPHMKKILIVCLFGGLTGCQSSKPVPLAPVSAETPVTASVGEVKLVEGKIGYLALRQFGATAGEEVAQALMELKRQGMDRWVLDLRGNWGGSLIGACGVVGLFFLPDTEVGVYHEPEGARQRLKVGGPSPERPPHVILVDQATASTAEWVAGVFRQSFPVKLVGSSTYGKGRVQQVSETGSRRLAIVTEGQVDLPSGSPVGGEGLKPDVRVEGRDRAMKKAVEVARNNP